MTADELLTLAERWGIRLEPRGDKLHVDGPAGAVTAELRDELARLKPALMDALATSHRYVTLQPDAVTGARLTLPVEPIQLAIDLERRGFRQWIAHGAYQIEPTAGLSETDRARITRWRLHLAAIVGYEPPEVG